MAKMAKSSIVHVIVLPMFGTPYEESVVRKSDTDKLLDTIQKGVGGFFENMNRKSVAIHPMFEDERWRLAQRLLGDRWTKVYVNEEGRPKNLAVNVGVVPLDKHNYPLVGDIVLVVRHAAMEGISPDTFKKREEEE
jgi:hypothetical protein